MNRICVYCGSSTGVDKQYVDVAREFAALLVSANIDLVYGGATKGLMGVIADTVLQSGGRVSGVIPKALQEKEIAHEQLTELHVVDSMHDRKSLMAILSDGFVGMPGGFGTLEEIIEVLTWGQLQFHEKPCGLLNINGYFDHLLAFFDHATNSGFLQQQHREMLLVADTPAALLDLFGHYEPPDTHKWM